MALYSGVVESSVVPVVALQLVALQLCLSSYCASACCWRPSCRAKAAMLLVALLVTVGLCVNAQFARRASVVAKMLHVCQGDIGGDCGRRRTRDTVLTTVGLLIIAWQICASSYCSSSYCWWPSS